MAAYGELFMATVSMAKARRITAKREVAERAADWRLRPYER
jgi:hypothetical protein